MLAPFLADDGPEGARARAVAARSGDAAIPDLADAETAAVLRKRWIDGTITTSRFAAAIDHLSELPFHRYPARPLLRRAFELRGNVTVYDAMYVALAEALDCELVTADGRLARAPGPRCEIRVVSLRADP